MDIPQEGAGAWYPGDANLHDLYAGLGITPDVESLPEVVGGGIFSGSSLLFHLWGSAGKEGVRWDLVIPGTVDIAGKSEACS